MCRALLRDPARMGETYYWRTLREHCSTEDWDRYINDGFTKFIYHETPNEATRGLRIFRKKLYNRLNDDNDIMVLKTQLKRKEGAIDQLLRNIYDEFRTSMVPKKTLRRANWLNWSQTPFKYWGLSTTWNEYKFVKYHLQFFKNKPLSFTLNHEIGAKLILNALHDTSMARNEAYAKLKLCIICQDLINNSGFKEIVEERLRDIREIFPSTWNKWGERMTELNDDEKMIELNAFLYALYDEELKTLQNSPKVIWVLEDIWLGGEMTKFYLKRIFKEIYDI